MEGTRRTGEFLQGSSKRLGSLARASSLQLAYEDDWYQALAARGQESMGFLFPKLLSDLACFDSGIASWMGQHCSAHRVARRHRASSWISLGTGTTMMPGRQAYEHTHIHTCQ